MLPPHLRAMRAGGSGSEGSSLSAPITEPPAAGGQAASPLYEMSFGPSTRPNRWCSRTCLRICSRNRYHCRR